MEGDSLLLWSLLNTSRMLSLKIHILHTLKKSARHILYAFANLRAATGEVFLSDEWSDKDIHYPGDSWDEPNTNLFGNFKQFMLMKRRHRHLKLLLSIGGWAYSASFDPVVVSPKLRANFVATAVRFVEDYGLDGLDIDYEYPKNDLQAQGFLELIRELRLALDALERRIGAGRFSLTVAAPCGVEHYRKLYLREMDSFLDFWNLMASFFVMLSLTCCDDSALGVRLCGKLGFYS